MRLDDNTRFMYPTLSFLYTQNRRQPVEATSTVTVAYRLTEGGVAYSAAFCAPNDAFSKSRGRLRAGGRLNSERWRRNVALSVTDSRSEDVMAAILKDLLGHLPSRWSQPVIL